MIDEAAMDAMDAEALAVIKQGKTFKYRDAVLSYLKHSNKHSVVITRALTGEVEIPTKP